MSWGHQKGSFKKYNPEEQKMELLNYKKCHHSDPKSLSRSSKNIHECDQNDKGGLFFHMTHTCIKRIKKTTETVWCMATRASYIQGPPERKNQRTL